MKGFVIHLLLALSFSLASQEKSEPDLQALIAQLSDDKAAARDAASQEIRKLGTVALPAILKARAAATDPEVKRRLSELLYPAGLKLVAGPDLVKDHKEITEQIKPDVDKYLAGNDQEREAALKALTSMSPQLALGVAVRLSEEKDPAAQIRLHEILYAMLEDSFERAELLRSYADALADLDGAVKGEKGHDLLCLRARAKTFHAAFINPERYHDQGIQEIATGEFGVMPYMDYPAAGDIYKQASAMYERLAKTTQDTREKLYCRAAAKKAIRRARQVYGLGAIVN